MKVRIGFTPGPFPSGAEGQGLLRQLVGLGDTHGYDSIWLSDRVVGGTFPLEPLVALSMVAAYSDTLKFGTSVLALPLRNPVLLAKELATLDYLSNGRLLPAVGLGQENTAEYQACGVAKENRGRRADEAIRVLRRLWQEDLVTHEGTFFRFHDVTITPKPVQRPSPPIWIGGRSKAAQRRTGRIGDGWLVSQATPQEVDEAKELIFSTATQYGRAIDEDHIGVMLGFCIASSIEEASAIAEPHANRGRSDTHYTNYCAIGPPEKAVAKIKEYLAAGASKFVVRPMCNAEETKKQLDIFGQEILPLLHG